MRGRRGWIAVASVLMLSGGLVLPQAAAAEPAPAAMAGSTADILAAMPECDPDFVVRSDTLFSDPSGSRADRKRLVNHLVQMIDCTPPINPDGTPASLTMVFYTLSYWPVREALVAAAQRGVAVHVLGDGHSDRLPAWIALADALGTDPSAVSFTGTCWRGCLRPRTPPTAGGPTAWYSAQALSASSHVAVFTDLSKPGSSPITSWAWDFGDGTHAVGQGPHRKAYPVDGVYTTTLTVRDAAGVTHRTTGKVAIPDLLEPEYPALHSKVFLASTVGIGRNARRWVSAYGSGNPSYHHVRLAFNNLNVSVGDRALYDVFTDYVADLIAGSRGELLTQDYNRTATTPGVEKTGSPATSIHFLPTASGDPQLDILRSITCRYTDDGRLRRTKVRISMFSFSRIELGAEVWRLAYERGCAVDLVYSTMTQRLRDSDGEWIRDDAGEVMPWGPADCLSTPPPTTLPNRLKSADPDWASETTDPLDDADGLCGGGTLDGSIAGASGGTWIDRVSPITGGRLTVTASCPLVSTVDTMLRARVILCGEYQLFTHQKVVLVNGMVHGKVQKYVMTGSANWTDSGLHYNDDFITELQDVPAIHDAYLAAHRHEKDVFVRIARAAR